MRAHSRCRYRNTTGRIKRVRRHDVVDYATAKSSDTGRFSRFFRAMREQGIYLAPSQFEAGFISLAHTDGDIEKTAKAAYASLKKARG